jgi:putative addiction module component (TIGR02574 family)
MEVPTKLLREVLKLTPVQRAALIDNLLASLDTADKMIDAMWDQEVESRNDAFEQGEIKAAAKIVSMA